MDDRFKVDEYLNNDIKNCIGKSVKFNGIKRYVRYEIKTDKYENRLFVSILMPGLVTIWNINSQTSYKISSYWTIIEFT